MNPCIALLFQAIPLAMGAICLLLGLTIKYSSPDSSAFVAGHVVIYLTSICIALYCTAATIIRLLTHSSSHAWRIAMPMLGYVVAGVTIWVGWLLMETTSHAPSFVAGHVVFGLGLISCCVTTVATASTRFTLIPANSKGKAGVIPDAAYSAGVAALLLLVPAICALLGLGIGMQTLFDGTTAPHFVAGCVLTGIGVVCASLIALVASVVRQVRNTYNDVDRLFWPSAVLALGSLCIAGGIVVLFLGPETVRIAPGCVLIGLGIVCYSILSKVLLLALVWRHSFPLANRIPLIPVLTALACLFIAAFLFQASLIHPAYYVPARVMVGLGAVCFTLFSIVSILESGTSE